MYQLVGRRILRKNRLHTPRRSCANSPASTANSVADPSPSWRRPALRARCPSIRSATPFLAAGAHVRTIVDRYPADPYLAAPVRLSFLGLKAKVADRCGEWPKDLAIGSGAAVDWSNKPYWNFGCAYQSAFAAQVADPRDLVAPQGESPADTAMRTRAIETSARSQCPRCREL